MFEIMYRIHAISELPENLRSIIHADYMYPLNTVNEQLSFALVEDDELKAYVLMREQNANKSIAEQDLYGCEIIKQHACNETYRLLCIKTTVDRIIIWIPKKSITHRFDYYWTKTNEEHKEVDSIDYDGDICTYIEDEHTLRHVILHKFNEPLINI